MFAGAQLLKSPCFLVSGRERLEYCQSLLTKSPSQACPVLLATGSLHGVDDSVQLFGEFQSFFERGFHVKIEIGT
jgi:hypothetical protein